MNDKDKKFYKAIQQWNKKKNLSNFILMYTDGFTYHSPIENPIFRVYRIIKNTVSGKYKKCEALFDSWVKEGTDNA